MKPTPTTIALLALLTLVILPHKTPAADAPPPAKNPDGELVATIAVPKRPQNNLELKNVLAAVIDAATTRGYKVESFTENKVTISHESGSWAVVFSIPCDETQVKLYAKGKIREVSIKPPGSITKKTVMTETTWPKRWVDTLKDDINKALIKQLVLK